MIKKDGRIILGFVDRDSPLGKSYEEHKSQDPFYREATFYSTGEVLALLAHHRLSVISSLQTVFGDLGDIAEPQRPRSGYGEGAFVVLVAAREPENR